MKKPLIAIGVILLAAYIYLRFKCKGGCSGTLAFNYDLNSPHIPTVKAPYSPINWARTLLPGDTGSEVTAIQEYLKAAGHTVVINGIYDGVTEAALYQVRKETYTGATSLYQIHSILANGLGNDVTTSIINKFKQ